MKFKYNIPFIADRVLEPRLRSWLGSYGSRILGKPDVVVEVAEVVADPDFARQMLNISWQFEFPTLEEAKAWGDSRYAEVSRSLAEHFGEDVMSFATILAENRD